MEEIVEVLLDVTGKLESAGIPYMISGSIAGNMYAEPRFTNDVDVVVHITKNNKEKIVALFGKEYYISEIAIDDAFAGAGMFNIIQNKWVIKCDLILLKTDAFSQSAFDRKLKEKIEDKEVYFISAEDLILQKLLWQKGLASYTQIQDIKKIISARPNTLDRNYLMAWAVKLDVADILSKYL
ncbi:hypothetical protein JNM05_01200 [bacterium]|nr:hypothetical protein [bacterium]